MQIHTNYQLVLGLIVCLGVSMVSADSLTMNAGDKIKAQAPIAVQSFWLEDVHLLDGPFKEAMERNSKWLISLEPDRFLAWFRKEAGLEPKGKVYGGWESNTIAGHCLGHYLSACAMMYGATGEQVYKDRTDYIVDELDACQKASGSGYLSAFPGGKKAFAEVSRGEIRSAGFDLNGIWVPWYTQHKIIAGLRDTYRFTKNPKALAVCVRHMDWIDSLLKELTAAQWQKMLDCEHGGMNEVCADMYALTGKEAYLELAKKFYDESVLEPLSRRQDSLAGLHANTQIPKIIGAARIYELSNDEKFSTIASFFWDTVVNHYTFANGGNSSNEAFGRPDKLAEPMHDTTETCNTYNMLKLTRHLFAWKPNAAYMDYYERALLNHILAHQHPETGMVMYKGFLDMPAKKSFCHPTESFWCCVGTGMENHSKYAEAIYAADADSLYVNLFISSRLNWQDKGMTVTLESDLPAGDTTTLLFKCEKPTTLTLKIRKPYWADRMTIAVNEKPQPIAVNANGYVGIKRIFKDGDTVKLVTPTSLHRSTLPDKPNRTAFLYGPTLLAAPLQQGQKSPLLVGPVGDALLKLFKQTGRLEFTASGIGYQSGPEGFSAVDIRLIPLFAIADQPYTVYMDVFTPEQWKKQQAEYEAQLQKLREREAKSVDNLLIGQMQPERDHNLSSENSTVGQFGGRTWRHAVNGWFEFDMKVLTDEPMDLMCTYWGSDAGGRKFDILVDGTKIATESLNAQKPNEFYHEIYAIPETLTKDKTNVRVRLQSHPNNTAGGLFGARMLKREK
jgi:DUF1680 family protein